MIKYVRLKQRFDVKKMQEEVCQLETNYWKPHYNTTHYNGTWTTLSLRSINGSVESGISLQGSSLQPNMDYLDTILLDKCPYLTSVIGFFECEKLSVRLMNLNAGAVIKEHRDHKMSFEEGEARFHIPIITNDAVDFFIEDERMPMKEGECWYLNLSLKHRVHNLGNIHRIHLVIDCKVNNRITDLLNGEAELKHEIPDKTRSVNYSDSDKIKIIQELRLMDTTVSIELADKMEKGVI